jgi:hypothetical protein
MFTLRAGFARIVAMTHASSEETMKGPQNSRAQTNGKTNKRPEKLIILDIEQLVHRLA